jgi:tRNA modification GTPase
VATAGLASGDVIAAVATPAGRGGIGIVRISGPDLAAWAEPLLGRPFTPRTAMRATFRDASGATLDDGIALFFPAPRSYTGEDVLELQGHGGPVVVAMILRRALELGARLAEPGEFTRRAFLNGRMDLAQAEAVADVIDASTEAAARSALRSLGGEFSRQVRALVDRLIELRMLVEAGLDFPEEEIDPVHRTDIDARLATLRSALDDVVRRARQGSVLRAGITLVLAGRPNVGKSSVLNRLAGESVAIVTPIAGTTRDAVRAAIQIEGVPVHVVDTAGLRDTDDAVERIGIERTWTEIERADGVLLVLDARDGMTEADGELVGRLPPALPRIVVWNKCDLLSVAVAQPEPAPDAPLHVSALRGDGFDRLREAILGLVGWQAGGEDVFVARERQLDALQRAGARLAEASSRQAASELLAEELRLAQEALNEITGEFTADDLLGEIFGRFCIGK